MLAAAQFANGRGMGRGEGLTDLLNDFTNVLEGADFGLIGWVIICSFGVSFTMISLVLMLTQPAARAWPYVFSGSLMCTLVSIVFLIEPRASHWLPSLAGVCEAFKSCRLSEWKMRWRRWWRWRTKYGRTKLNV